MDIFKSKISFFLIDYSCGGGVERATADLISNFKSRNVHVEGLVSLYKQFENPYIQYHKDLKIDILNPTSKKDYYNKFLTYFQTNKPDVFIFQGDNMTISLAILKAAKKSGVIAIGQYHGSVYAYLQKYSDAEKSNFFKKVLATIVYPFKKTKVEKYIKSAENGLVCVSKGAANELKAIFSSAITRNIQTIYNPIFLSEEPNLFEKDNSVSFVSRLESKHKNAFLIVKMWEEIAEKYPDWVLNIYGTGSLEQKMKDFCNHNGIKNIEFNGFVNNISEELTKSKISVSTSNCEGFSMAVAEAISKDNAIVSTNSDGGIKDMLIPGSTALLSPKNDAVMLAKNLEKLILDDDLRIKLQVNAKENLKEIVSIDIFEKWLELIKNVSL